MQRALILGAGGFGREVLTYALARGDWDIAGFLDANPRALDGFACPVPILGDPLTVDLPPGVLILCAIGDPRTKLRLCRTLRQRGARFGTLIHPTAIVGPSCRIGEGCTIGPFSTLTTHVRIGDFVVLNAYASAGHDAIVGDGCTLSAHCDVTGGAVLGEGVFMGTHASVVPRIRVGDYAVIGAGSVAMWSVRAHSTVLGVPAIQIATARERKGA
jgi:sugar O-acyltransferase (sialic acid O-acetyltransferase NeuD family)